MIISLIIMIFILVLILSIILFIVYFQEISYRIKEFFDSGIGYGILIIFISILMAILFTNYVFQEF